MSQNEFNEINEEEEQYEELKNHPDYLISKTYPYNIKKKSTGKIIKECVRSKSTGYLCCKLGDKLYNKHRLIAEQWIPNPDNLPQVDHKNGIRTDNRIENLRFVSHSDNQRNKLDYKGIKSEYIDELPPDSIKIELYKGIEFENYYYSKETQKCYYDNGVKIRVLKYHLSGSGYKFINVHDLTSKRRNIYIDAWLRSECLE